MRHTATGTRKLSSTDILRHTWIYRSIRLALFWLRQIRSYVRETLLRFIWYLRVSIFTSIHPTLFFHLPAAQTFELEWNLTP